MFSMRLDPSRPDTPTYAVSLLLAHRPEINHVKDLVDKSNIEGAAYSPPCMHGIFLRSLHDSDNDLS